MKTIRLLLLSLLTLSFFVSCDVNSSSDTDIEVPPTYEFERNGESTVSFSGQTTRIKMGDELYSAMLDFENTTEELLLQMYRNQDENGNNVDPYSDSELNESTKSIKSKVAASRDYFSSNASLSVEIKNDFETWIAGQIDEVFPNSNQIAEAGVPGQIADGSGERYINALGLEYDQMVAKGLNGALMADQMLNNYLSPAVLDEGSNREDNDEGVTADGANYTTMEHKWDEAFGYLYGTDNQTNPQLGADSFLNKYVARVENDDDFAGIADRIYDAFTLGRAAIVGGDYDLRDQQANVIREEISKIIAIRAVYYLLIINRKVYFEKY